MLCIVEVHGPVAVGVEEHERRCHPRRRGRLLRNLPDFAPVDSLPNVPDRSWFEWQGYRKHSVPGSRVVEKWYLKCTTGDYVDMARYIVMLTHRWPACMKLIIDQMYREENQDARLRRRVTRRAADRARAARARDRARGGSNNRVDTVDTSG